MLEDKIIKLTKNDKVIVFFDMDGVCAEYGADEGHLIKENYPGFYFTKRPIKSVLAIMKRISEIRNVQVRILSNCYFPEQKQDKINWLAKYAPFIKTENITIITLNEEEYTSETKDFIKGNYIKKITAGSNAHLFLIEDDHGIIKATKKLLPNVQANHVSTLIK